MTRAISVVLAVLVSPLALGWVAVEWFAGRRRDETPPRCPDCGGPADVLSEGEITLVGVVRVRCRRCGRRTLAEWR